MNELNRESSFQIYGISDKLESIQSAKPFQIIFYGSRERGDYSEISDYNFYLIASPTDQLRRDFIQSINQSLSSLESVATVSLISTDPDSFKARIKLFDPGAIHIADAGRIFFGSGEFDAIQKNWYVEKSSKIPDTSKLLDFLEGRLRFFKKLSVKHPKDEVSRLERVIAYHIQIWCIEKISDISAEELITLDIPSRVCPLVENLYAKELNEDIQNLLGLYTQIHSLKRIVRYSLPQSGVNLKGLKKLTRALQETKIN